MTALWWPSERTRDGVMHDGCDHLGVAEGDRWACPCGAQGATEDVE